MNIMRQPRKGDWVRITKSNIAWTPAMDVYHGRVVQILDFSGDCIEFDGDGGWMWSFACKHYKVLLFKSYYDAYRNL